MRRKCQPTDRELLEVIYWSLAVMRQEQRAHFNQINNAIRSIAEIAIDEQRKIMATLEEANAAVQQLKTDIEAFLASVQPGQLTPEQQALVDNIAATAQSVDGEVVPPQQ